MAGHRQGSHPLCGHEKLLIVNGDDMGRSPGVSAGILQAHRRGLVSSSTVMVNLPGAAAAVRHATAQAERLGLGVHLNLTAGPPVLPPETIPSLVGPAGCFYPVRHLVPRLAALDLGQVRAELVAQIERFRSWGREPTHFDCHHHLLYLDPRLFRVLTGLAQQYRVPIRYPWPRGEERTHQELAALAEAHRVPPSSLPSIIAGCHAVLAESGVRVPDRCLLSFYGATATLEHLCSLLAGLPPGVSELMCHPGIADDELRAQSNYVEGRERELSILTDPRARRTLSAAGIRLVSFLDL